MFEISKYGPVMDYLDLVDKDQIWFEKQLAKGDPAAASLYAAECIVRALEDVQSAIDQKD